MERASLAGGCFWCLEAVFQLLAGVRSARPGYTGGDAANPTYEQVCSGRTGHAEAVRIEFDPATLSFEDLLNVFFAIHDPTTLDRQGGDTGTQYRSAIFYESEAQRATAERTVANIEAAGVWPNPIVTEIVPLGDFYPAEEYHNDYFRRNPNQPYCQAVVAPKVAKFRRDLLHRLNARSAAASPSAANPSAASPSAANR